MSTHSTIDDQPDKQSDRLLWLAASVVAGVALTWLVISRPWSSGVAAPADLAATTTPAQASRVAAAETGAGAGAGTRPVEPAAATQPGDADPDSGLDSGLGDPLRMAQLAYEAGMLIEPEDYSAWTLFASVLDSEPDNSVAVHGLTKIADELLQRGSVALEQARFDDARATAERILTVLPEHAGARALAERVAESAPSPAPPTPVPVIAPAPEPEIESAGAEERATVAPPVIEPEPRADPILEGNEAFELAMRENRLLTPADRSAKHFVGAMIAADPEHELTRAARQMLAAELLMRSRQALEALDTDAARTWIDEAEPMALDPDSIGEARRRLTGTLIRIESSRQLPASAFEITEYVAPVYPSRAVARQLEGWVDIEFTVTTDGSTRDVTVTDASHESFFRREATRAVEQWRFEPRVFMDQTIEQRSYTTIRFALE